MNSQSDRPSDLERGTDRVYVFNIGLNKAGTTSLSTALNKLGIPTCHYYCLCRRGAGPETSQVYLGPLLQNNIKKGKRPFEGLDHQVRGFCDFNGHNLIYGGVALLELLDYHYPNSKFIFTTRDLKSWLISKTKHVERNIANPHFKGSDVKIEEDRWREVYSATHHKIRSYFRERPNDLLIMDIAKGDRWEVLCNFLGKDIPSEPFPLKNAAPPE